MTSEAKVPITNISAVGLIHRESDPSRIYIDFKDDGLPVKAFRRTLCPVGGNWIGEGAKADADPLATFRRELLEELSFEKVERSSEEYVDLGIADLEVFGAVGGFSGAEVTAEDHADLAHLKRTISESAAPFGDYLTEIPKSVLDAADPENKRNGFTVLVSYYRVGLSDEDWTKLERLQRKFGNLSNESISVILSLAEIVEKGIKCAFAHDIALRDFFRSRDCKGADGLPIYDGTHAERVHDPLGSYAEYLERYDVAKTPL